MTRLCALLLVFGLSLLAHAAALADTHTLKNVTLTAPADLSVEVDGGTAALFNKDATLLILVLNDRQDDLPINDASYLKSALRHSREGIARDSDFENVRFGEVSKHNVNRMTGFRVDGTATQDGTPTTIQLMALQTPGQHMVLVITMHPTDDTYRLRPLINQVINSITPIQTP